MRGGCEGGGSDDEHQSKRIRVTELGVTESTEEVIVVVMDSGELATKVSVTENSEEAKVDDDINKVNETREESIVVIEDDENKSSKDGFKSVDVDGEKRIGGDGDGDDDGARQLPVLTTNKGKEKDEEVALLTMTINGEEKEVGEKDEEVPVPMNGNEVGESSSSNSKSTYGLYLADVMEILTMDSSGDFDYIEMAESRGMVFPRPIWWPKEGEDW